MRQESLPTLDKITRDKPIEWKAAEYLVALASADHLKIDRSSIISRFGDLDQWKSALHSANKRKTDALWNALITNNRFSSWLNGAGLVGQETIFGKTVVIGDDAIAGQVADVEINGEVQVPISVKHNSRELKCLRLVDSNIASATNKFPDSIVPLLDQLEEYARNNTTWSQIGEEKKRRIICQFQERFCQHLSSLSIDEQECFARFILGHYDYYMLSFGNGTKAWWAKFEASKVTPKLSVTHDNKFILFGGNTVVACEMRFDNKDKHIKRNGMQVKFNLVQHALSF